MIGGWTACSNARVRSNSPLLWFYLFDKRKGRSPGGHYLSLWVRSGMSDLDQCLVTIQDAD